MKKLIFAILFSVLIIPGLASADIVSDLQAQINQLLQQIRALQAQLAAQQTTTPTTPTSCPNLIYNLYLGLSDSQTEGQVSMLQKFLAQDSSIYPEGLITGYFGPATERAVQAWQAKNNIVSSGSPDTTGYGVVGPQTRAAINKSCQQTTPSLTVLSPNGGESMTVNLGPYTIAWQQSQNTTVSVWLQNKGLPPKPNTDAAYYTKSILEEFNGRVGRNVYGWTISNDISPTSGYEICVGGYFNVGLERPAMSQDCSNAPFSIVAPAQTSTTTTTTTPIPVPILTLSANSQKLDYNNDGKLDQADTNFLNDVLLRKITCPTNKICDVNRSGVFTVADVVTLTNITLGTASTPDYKTSLLEANSQKLDYNNDNVLDSKDSDFLTGVMLRKWTCPTAKICDVNQDGQSATISDVVKLTNITLGTTPVPDFGVQSSNASLSQMASVLEGMRGILEQLAGLLK